MSVIVGKVYEDKIVLAADSICVRGYTQEKKRFSKLWQENGLTVASCGMARDGAMLRIFCKRNNPPEATESGLTEFLGDFLDWSKKKDSGVELKSNFLICFREKLFRVENFYIHEIPDFSADGAGMDFALAALHLGKSPQEAVKIACELSVYCETPVNVIEVPRVAHASV